jgi:hypothetical protein
MQFAIRTIALCSFVFVFMRLAHGSISIPGDYNQNGVVSHGDYSILGDTYGQIGIPGLFADGNGDGMVGQADFNVYMDNYGSMLSLPGTLPFDVIATPIGSNVHWVFFLSGVNGALAGHVNIQTSGPTVVDVLPGAPFMDDGLSPVGVKGINASNTIQQGISFSGSTAFAALGTNLVDTTAGPPLVNETLHFMTLITSGTQPTTLTVTGEYGYQSLDYIINQSASFVPEPTSLSLIALLAVGLPALRARRIPR